MKPIAHTGGSKARGFTLLEVLIAVAIFVIVGMLAMTGYNELMKQTDRVDEGTARTRAIQATMMRMSQDFALLEPRAVRPALGEDPVPALRAGGETGGIELTHSGWSNPAGVPRPTLQRVSYRLEDTELYRDYWPVLDRTQSVEPVSVVLLDRVKSVSVRYMGADRDWKEQWPPLGFSGPTLRYALPIAVEITLELEDWGKIVRVVEVAG
ncbi:MAG TPA: type II secretion system minor pseudopilin GspJ [Povalibacter sp.]|uniref:type II secretion system minor pseudopilin GspJ n=1 Tax=Povalibacter sp. TaxID=1962978 RepID=UPI002CC26A2B|nr:type II secretion system minor pseudopilin GspJ [Povalibacter sp.]HMN43295.1 type II secretion system minor pseudopilin GspJ [Povalibacter sp.]